MAVTSFPQCKEAGRRSHSSSGNQHREIRNCPSSSHPCPGAREQLSVRSVLSGIILRRPCLTPVRPAFAIIKEYRIYHQLARGLELLMASYDISAFPLSQQAISPHPMPLPCLRPLLWTIAGLLLFCYSSFFKGSLSQAKQRQCRFRRQHLLRLAVPVPMAGEHSVSVPPPLSQCFSAPPSKASN